MLDNLYEVFIPFSALFIWEVLVGDLIIYWFFTPVLLVGYLQVCSDWVAVLFVIAAVLSFVPAWIVNRSRRRVMRTAVSLMYVGCVYGLAAVCWVRYCFSPNVLLFTLFLGIPAVLAVAVVNRCGFDRSEKPLSGRELLATLLLYATVFLLASWRGGFAVAGILVLFLVLIACVNGVFSPLRDLRLQRFSTGLKSLFAAAIAATALLTVKTDPWIRLPHAYLFYVSIPASTPPPYLSIFQLLALTTHFTTFAIALYSLATSTVRVPDSSAAKPVSHVTEGL